MASNLEISTFLQRELGREERAEVTAVEAAAWLDQAGLLPDSPSKPGKPLRALLRDGKISGGQQHPPVANGRWFITKSDGAEQLSEPSAPAVFDRDECASEASADSAPSRDLDIAVTRTVEELGPEAPWVELEDLPDEPGLYTLQAPSDQAREALGLDDHPGQSPLVERILYLGKAQDSVRSRLSDDHFALGKTGHSTVRRTLAALLDLPVIPRPSGVAKPSRKQLMTMTANYAVPLAEDEWLSAWMRSNLLVRGLATSWDPLAHLERAAGEVLNPPLDQEKVPFWAPNPWRADVAAARERKRREARQRIGLV